MAQNAVLSEILGAGLRQKADTTAFSLHRWPRMLYCRRSWALDCVKKQTLQPFRSIDGPECCTVGDPGRWIASKSRHYSLFAPSMAQNAVLSEILGAGLRQKAD